MRAAIYDLVEPSIPPALPLRLTQTCARRSAAIVYLIVLIPVAAVVLATALTILSGLFAPGARGVLQARPAVVLEVVAAVGFLILLLVLPAKRLIARLISRRHVEIANGTVTVMQGGRFQARIWSTPLSSYAGVTHHVRASLSGTRHELILVHPERDKSILLSVAPRTSQCEVDRVAQLLGQRQLPPSELYRFKDLWPRLVMPPHPDASHA